MSQETDDWVEKTLTKYEAAVHYWDQAIYWEQAIEAHMQNLHEQTKEAAEDSGQPYEIIWHDIAIGYLTLEATERDVRQEMCRRLGIEYGAWFS